MTGDIECSVAMLNDFAHALESIPEGIDRDAIGAWQGSIDAHVRHVVDHHVCLFDGIERGAIEYDDRTRDRRIEKSANVRHALAFVSRALVGLAHSPEDQVLVRICHRGVDEQAASTLARELAFRASHAIHRSAIVALACWNRGIVVTPTLGVAPSTRPHWQSTSTDRLVMER